MVIDALKSDLFRKNIKKKSEDNENKKTFDDVKLIESTDSQFGRVTQFGRDLEDDESINITVKELRNICKSCVMNAFEVLFREGYLDINEMEKALGEIE